MDLSVAIAIGRVASEPEQVAAGGLRQLGCTGTLTRGTGWYLENHTIS
jgi:hypothetical protein